MGFNMFSMIIVVYYQSKILEDFPDFLLWNRFEVEKILSEQLFNMQIQSYNFELYLIILQ